MREIISQASNRIQASAREKSVTYAAAQANVQALHASGDLDEARLAEFAHAGKFDETAVALSLMCDLPITLIERALVEERAEQIIVIARAFGLKWETVRFILLLQDKVKDDVKYKFEQQFAIFARLSADTAKKAIQFYRFRERATTPRPH